MDEPLVEIQKFFWNFFFCFGGGWKKDPLPSFFMGELKAFWGRALGGIENFGHFGQATAPTHKAWIQGGVGVRGYGGRGI